MHPYHNSETMTEIRQAELELQQLRSRHKNQIEKKKEEIYQLRVKRQREITNYDKRNTPTMNNNG